MLIVQHSSLVEDGGFFSFREVLFSGVSLQTKDGIVLQRNLFDSGKCIGLYENPVFPDSSRHKHILSSAFGDPVDFEYGQEAAYLFRGEHFNGWAYFFKDGICRKEQFISLGFESSGCVYGSEGRLASVEIYENTFQQIVKWFDDGKIKEFWISDEGVEFHCAHNEFGDLTAVRVQGSYFGAIDLGKYRRIDNPFRDFGFLKGARVRNGLVLGGDQINEDVLHLFVSEVCGLKFVKILTAISIMVSPSFLKKFVLSLDLDELNLDRIAGVDFECALDIKKSRPMCRVFFEGRNVLL